MAELNQVIESLGAGASQSDRIWIEAHPKLAWAPGLVDVLTPDGKYVVLDDEGERREIAQGKAVAVDPHCLEGVPDLLRLGDFHEGGILHNVRVRYFENEIYTTLGGPILISINPYQNFPELYSIQKQNWYWQKSAAQRGVVSVDVPPHLFAVGADSYVSMLADAKDQSIIISGESGAGKTEATKYLLGYFANLQSDQQRNVRRRGSLGMSIEEQVFHSTPILEAFGNAKTIRNDNSSRFGKFTEIEFTSTGKLNSAQMRNYLLEKSRIVQQQPEERGYHAFYMLCAAAPTMEINTVLGIGAAEEHAYTRGCTTIPGVDDREMFVEMVLRLGNTGFDTDELNNMFKILAAILHLGDLQFEEYPDTTKGTKICEGTKEKGEKISELLCVEHAAVVKVFQFKTMEDPMSKKIIDMPQKAAGASNVRHSMAKVIYSSLFNWLVLRINKATEWKGATEEGKRKIGVLDIFGFEIFKENSFEQLCINFANEKLQQDFNFHMFTLEQQLYTEEGISWSHIEFPDNQDIIDALEKKPLGLFCIIDSECISPGANDDTCLRSIFSLSKSPKIIYKPGRVASSNFAVAHYAGVVVYDVVSFLEKNTDKLHGDILKLMRSSKMELVQALFAEPPQAAEPQDSSIAAQQFNSMDSPRLQQAMKTVERCATAPDLGIARRTSAPSVHEKGPVSEWERNAELSKFRTRPNTSTKRSQTVSMMFRQQLDQLVADVRNTNPRYVRCIKPNSVKRAQEFDSSDVLRQLRCAGMLESIRIRRAGYPVRTPFEEFYKRFRILCPTVSTEGKAEPNFRDLCTRLLTEVETKLKNERPLLVAHSWQVGLTKVYLKDELQQALENHVATALLDYILRLQRGCRAYLYRKHLPPPEDGQPTSYSWCTFA
uniref:Myosin motor domain-containing protein n=1 Tax=Noctiluca scintillans TaxID=2966 RepID=A0A7S0ZVD5_NOCSC|mmetsp:Transcript_20337/g.54344  ORF Transcript_20337/g.54344 Transcript_20337/m.54344 type:complete len:887 (+) Transcript_20337:68-2728(+)